MIIEAENDDGPFKTLFRAFENYNVRLTWAAERSTPHGLTVDRAHIEAAIRDVCGDGVYVQLFVGEEDEPSGDTILIAFRHIEAVQVH